MRSALAALWFALLFNSASHAVEIPDALAPWVDWVKARTPEAQCPVQPAEGAEVSRACVWISEIALELGDGGAQFSQRVMTYAPAWVALPGDRQFWPQQLSDGTHDLPVVWRDGAPSVYLAPGEYRLTGQLQWQQRPASLRLPPATGLILLSNQGQSRSAQLDDAGRLWLDRPQVTQPADAGNQLSVEVYRRLIDAVPLRLETELRLSVSGQVRESRLGPVLPPGFVAMALDSPLPSRLEPDGQLKLQLKPGEWRLRLQARQQTRSDTLHLASAPPPWPSQEIWSFAPDLSLRQLELSGAEQVDTRQLNLPDGWQALATYRMSRETPLKLQEQRRGDVDAGQAELGTRRQLWLDFQGQGFTVADDISARVPVQTRLSSAAPYVLGRADLDGEAIMITTQGANTPPGITLPPGQHQLHSVSRLPVAHGQAIDANGWQQPLQQLEATLHLPPGWTLLHVAGADLAQYSWLSRWSLLDIFIVLFVALGIGRLFGPAMGGLALLALVLGYHAQGKPLFLWINLLASLALCSLLPAGRFKQGLTLWARLGLGGLILLAASFSASQLQQVMYPTLEFDRTLVGSHYGDYAAPTEAASSEQAAIEADTAGLASSAPLRKSRMEAQAEAKPVPQGPEGITQTGPGTPAWHWQSVSLQWNGPVAPGQQMQLLLLSPWQTKLFKLLQVLSLALLLAALVVRHLRDSGVRLPQRSTASALILLLAAGVLPGTAPKAQAGDMPSPELLNELQQRVLPPPACGEECASYSDARLAIRDHQLRLSLGVDAQHASALALPLVVDGWRPTAVLLNGAPATLARAGGQWQIALPAGRQRIELIGPAQQLAKFHFDAPVPNLTLDAPGWRAEGLAQHQAVQGGISLHEESAERRRQDTDSDLQPSPVEPFAVVARSIQLGLDSWQVETRVQRLAPAAGALQLQVPLLPGESITSAGIAVNQGQAQVKMAADQSELVWHSRLPMLDALSLTASNAPHLVERWRLEPGPHWEVQQAEGIPPVREGEYRRWQWMPWPGEQVVLRLTRPQAVPGATVTIESAKLDVRPGAQLQESTLTLVVRASQGGELPLTLPAGAELLQWRLDGKPQPRRQAQQTLKIPLHPGQQQVQLNWREAVALGSLSRTPSLSLPLPATNIEIEVNAPQGRWPLLLGGPSIGPAVLLWGVLGVTVLVAIGLGRVRSLPLKTWQWLLLGVGLSLLNTYGAALLVVWFGLMARRGQGPMPGSRTAFNSMQIGLGLLSLLALITLISAIPLGLLGQPDMKIAGNGSHQHLWRWYQDQSEGPLPQAWVISLPMLAYRAVILAWALWLSTAALSWGRWAWTQFNHGGLWRSSTQDALVEPVAKEKPINAREK